MGGGCHSRTRGTHTFCHRSITNRVFAACVNSVSHVIQTLMRTHNTDNTDKTTHSPNINSCSVWRLLRRHVINNTLCNTRISVCVCVTVWLCEVCDCSFWAGPRCHVINTTINTFGGLHQRCVSREIFPTERRRGTKKPPRDYRCLHPPPLTLERLALHQIHVVRFLEDAALEATAQALQVATVNVEHESRHRDFWGCCGDVLDCWINGMATNEDNDNGEKTAAAHKTNRKGG